MSRNMTDEEVREADLAIARSMRGKLCEGCPPESFPEAPTRCGPCPRRHVPHFIVRAKERHGLDITIEEKRELEKRCYRGEGLQHTPTHKGDVHLLTFKGQVLSVIYKRPGLLSGPTWGNILTVVPPGYGARYSELHERKQAKLRKWGKR